jgi:16S rRNA (adenine1518-N6/adenine1519-N6)-dimethyltransferase
MQTKQDIERLLAGAGTQPKHRLGQNFLIDLNLMRLLIENLMRLLIEAAHLKEQDVVLEVGTGTGSFSLFLKASQHTAGGLSPSNTTPPCSISPKASSADLAT